MISCGVDFPLYTSRYAEKRLAGCGLAAMGITVGHPRFRLTYRLSGKIRVLAPERAWFSFSEAEFEARYVAKLATVGVEGVARELRVAFESRDEKSHTGLVLLCFEDLSLPDSFCHRRLFASWFERETGQPVPELSFPEGGL